MTNHLVSIIETSKSNLLPGLVWAVAADAEGQARELPLRAPIAFVPEGWLWLHFNLSDTQTMAFIEALPWLPRPCTTLLKTRDDIPQLRTEDGVTYGVIPDLQRDIDTVTDTIGLLYVVMSDRLLITGRHNTLSSAGAVRQQVLGGVRIRTVEALLEAIIEQVVDGCDLSVDRMSREVDALEDRILSGTISDTRGRLARTRRSAMRLHRHISELRSLFQRLDREAKRLPLPDGLVTLASRLLQETDQVGRDVTAMNERARNLQDEIANLLTEETNKHLRVLSILTILFLPPTFIAGLFGMNLQGMLLSDHHLGFWGATALAVASSFAVIWILRRIGIMGRREEE